MRADLPRRPAFPIHPAHVESRETLLQKYQRLTATKAPRRRSLRQHFSRRLKPRGFALLLCAAFVYRASIFAVFSP